MIIINFEQLLIMKRILILLLSFCLLPAQSQLLWQVSGHGLVRPSYLFGTHHLIPVSFLDSLLLMKTMTNVTTELKRPTAVAYE